MICRNCTRSYNIHSFSYPDVRAVLNIYISSRSHELADSDTSGTLDSCSGKQNEHKNTHNNVIEL